MFLKTNCFRAASIALLVSSLFIVISCKAKKESIPSYAPLITEISPQYTDSEGPWIELYNPTNKKVDASGIILVINDEYRFEIPEKLAIIPPKKHVLVHLYQKDGQTDVYDFKKGNAVLYAGSKFDNAIKAQSGQVAVYMKKKDQEELVDFVAWGATGSLKSLTPERHAIWKKNWYVPQVKSFGDYDERMITKAKNFTIARYPGVVGSNVSDWVVLYGKDRTPGAENQIPGVGMFTLTNKAVVQNTDISVGWTTNKYAQSFKFEIARDSAFTDIVEQTTLTKPLYKPKSVLPAGTYYYRVKVIDLKGRESGWSRVMQITSKQIGSSADGGVEDGAIITEVVLTDMLHKHQKKDTRLLCLDGCASHLDGTTVKHWDNVHPEAVPIHGDHGDMNCVRASISMMVSFYGNTLSQDRIAYFTQEERVGVGNNIPELDLAHSDGMGYPAEETAALEWALDETITDFVDHPNPTFADLKGWLDASRPIMTRRPGHLRTMNGYREEDDGTEWVHILDPWSGPRWETYDTWNAGAEAAQGTWVGPVTAPNAREDEPEIWTDSDGDGVMDFDEQIRFATGQFDLDSDNDLVDDKEDIYEYVFQFGNTYSKRDADFDADGNRKETDPDNDADTYSDGCEDKNGNGIYESASGETNNFAADAGVVCDEKPVHIIIVFDRSGSMSVPAADSKYDRATDATTLFLDAWLANDPPALSKVGLVYYDHSAYFDDAAATSTVLELLTEAKRDKIVASYPLNDPHGGSTSIGGGILKAMEAQGFDSDNISADDQHRVIVVLTDGKENSGVRMDNASVTSALVDGKVDGYVLGIGDDTQIDAVKLGALSEILNHPPASLADDLTEFELEKFFLQVLAETQGMEFSVDPVEQMSVGQTKTHAIPVNPGADKVNFVVVWNEANGKIDFTLKDPNGNAVAADITKTHTRYQISTKSNPTPGQWTLTLTASSTGTPTPSVIHYSIMAMEKNTDVQSHFTVQPGSYLAGNQIKLTATLAKNNRALKNGNVVVNVTSPSLGLGKFTAQTPIRIPSNLKALEKDIKMTAIDKKYQVMALKNIRIPTKVETVELNDKGIKGDEIPSDGIYSGIFENTRNDGVYTFHFLANGGSKNEVSALNREKVITVQVSPKIKPQLSVVNVLDREYRITDKYTYMKLNVTPKDDFGKLIGPGYSDQINVNIGNAEVVNIVDNLNGSYSLEVKVPGKYETKPLLQSTYKVIDLKQ